MRNLRDLADENGLDYVSTTDQANGYPSNIQIAITGFETYEEAEKFAAENDLKLIQIEKKDGWQLWHRRGAAYGPISVSADDYGADYLGIFPCDEFEFFENEVKGDLVQLLEDGAIKSLDDLQEYMQKKFKIQDEVILLEDGDFALMNSGNYIETVKSTTMRCHIDATTTEIAAILN